MGVRKARPASLGDEFPTILAAAQANQGWAFERLYRMFAPVVVGYLRVQGCPDPDDVTNEVFLSAFRSIASFVGDEGNFRSWLFTVAHRRLTDERRRSGRRPRLSDQDFSRAPRAGGDVEEEALRRLGTERVRQLCGRLAPDQRDVLLLRMVSGLSIEQAAHALGKSPTAVKALQRRALNAVRRTFDREGVSL